MSLGRRDSTTKLTVRLIFACLSLLVNDTEKDENVIKEQAINQTSDEFGMGRSHMCDESDTDQGHFVTHQTSLFFITRLGSTALYLSNGVCPNMFETEM